MYMYMYMHLHFYECTVLGDWHVMVCIWNCQSKLKCLKSSLLIPPLCSACRHYMQNPNAIIMCIQGELSYIVHVHVHTGMHIHMYMYAYM